MFIRHFHSQAVSAVLSDSPLHRSLLHNYTARDASAGNTHTQILSFEDVLYFSHILLSAKVFP